jgi:hypothetical protein
LEIAWEMARLVLEMRHVNQTAKLKRRLEVLAEHFLRITGQGGESNPIAPIQNGSRTSGGVTLAM